MSLIPKSQRFTPPKELPDELEALGVVGFDHKTCRLLVNAIRKAGGVDMVRKKYVKPVDAVKWLVANPGWSPYGNAVDDKNQMALFPTDAPAT